MDKNIKKKNKKPTLQDRSKPRKRVVGTNPIEYLETFDNSAMAKEMNLFLSSNYSRTLYDAILANLIALTAIVLSMFIPVVSFGLPFLIAIYFEIGLWGYIYKKEKGQNCRYEDVFVSIKKYIKIFCMAVAKIFMVLFWTVMFIVPGVICLLNLSFTGLILYESDDLDVKGIIMLSKELTKGYRWVIFFWALVSLASICVAMSLAFMIIVLFDYFLVVSNIVYIVVVLSAAILDFVLFALPMMEFTITDCYILSKQKRTLKCYC